MLIQIFRIAINESNLYIISSRLLHLAVQPETTVSTFCQLPILNRRHGNLMLVPLINPTTDVFVIFYVSSETQEK